MDLKHNFKKVNIWSKKLKIYKIWAEIKGYRLNLKLKTLPFKAC